MATIVLTAVGTLVGGPIGALAGAVAGSAIDSALFAPKARQGPRLGDLAVQTSSYGTAIPKLFGTLRAAGTVIWSTDLQEQRGGSGGGKGRPRTVEYSYSASFAVALSGRPIGGVRRIWADGKLLRGVAGDFKTATKYRLYRGSEDQAVDPLIASAEGAGSAPAYRGLAYAVFEDFQLADYGNRIPSLTFEVEADGGAVSIGAIASELSGGAVAAGSTPVLGGYAASGDSVRGAIEALSDVVPLSLIEREGRLLMTLRDEQPIAVRAEELGAGARGESGRSEFVRTAAGVVAGEVSVAYYDPARDFQTGLQRASRPGAARRTDRKALPAAITAGEAKVFAEQRLAAIAAARATGIGTSELARERDRPRKSGADRRCGGAVEGRALDVAGHGGAPGAGAPRRASGIAPVGSRAPRRGTGLAAWPDHRPAARSAALPRRFAGAAAIAGRGRRRGVRLATGCLGGQL
jgi:hypothetical protein